LFTNDAAVSTIVGERHRSTTTAAKYQRSRDQTSQSTKTVQRILHAIQNVTVLEMVPGVQNDVLEKSSQM
jgi:hypothetical protein